jgi:hypothetical protein
LPASPMQLFRCTRCGGPLFLDDFNMLKPRTRTPDDLDERPRRGRPRKRPQYPLASGSVSRRGARFRWLHARTRRRHSSRQEGHSASSSRAGSARRRGRDTATADHASCRT